MRSTPSISTLRPGSCSGAQVAEKVRNPIDTSILPYYASCHSTKGATDAGSRRAIGIDVQLHLAGGARAGGPPVACGSPHHGSRPRSDLAAIRPVVCAVWAAVDSARAAVARAAAAGAVYDSQRATADGAVGLQPVVPVVRGPGAR